MLNNQSIEKRDLYHDGSVEVHHAWETIQGEGPFAGTPAVFLRLAGCNLQCPWCDTDYTSQRERMSVFDVLELITNIRPSGLVVVTGGEPMRQNIGPLCKALLVNGYKPQIETNGTFCQEDLPDGVIVVCSPKTPKLHKDSGKFVSAWKYVLQAGYVGEDGLPTSALGGPSPARPTNNAEVYLQPLDEGDGLLGPLNQANLDAVVASCMQHGYRLCLQTHKLIGLE